MTARLRVVVADDERPARAFLLTLLRAFDDVVVVGEAASGREAVTLIERERPDLALLDWQMPEMDGIGVVKALKKHELLLVAFVTAYDEYAVRAFEVNAVDYLLKPVESARLREALNRAQERMEHAGSPPMPRSSPSKRRAWGPPCRSTSRPPSLRSLSASRYVSVRKSSLCR